jgi:hypothetical protein
MSAGPPDPDLERPRYRERSCLSIDALAGEQNYLDRMSTDHVRTRPHRWGVALGLELVVTGASVVVARGVAIDGAGNYLVVREQVRVPVHAADTYVSLVRRDGSAHLVQSDRPPPDRAHRLLSCWPVCLGMISAAGTVSSELRDDSALIAGHVDDPAGSARLVFGAEADGAPTFQVQRARDGGWGDVLAVSRGGAVTTITDDLSLGDGIDCRGELRFDDAHPAPAQARPWTVARVAVSADGQQFEQLRFELVELTQGVDATANSFAIGVPRGALTTPPLVVGADGTVSVARDLEVAGAIVKGALGGGAGTLADLAMQEGDLLAQAQAILNRSANTELTATMISNGFVGSVLRFTVTLNATLQVDDVAVYRTVVVGSGIQLRGFLSSGRVVRPAASVTIQGSVDAATVASGVAIQVPILAIGVGPDGQPRSATTQLNVNKP